MAEDTLIEKFKAGNIRALAKIISSVENKDSDYRFFLDKLNPLTGNTHVIGFTGSPGAGKSSLIDNLVSFLRTQNKTVGIIAVDPSSPFTGGAVLGDRIRMIKHSTDKGVYIRSMANRGQSGGLSRATSDVLKVIDAFGFDVIIIETVGAGQTEVDIVKTADTVVVVLNPETGDDIQAIKAGIMEIADIFTVSKADLPGAGKARLTIENAVRDSKKETEWIVPVILSSAHSQEGQNELWKALISHYTYLKTSGELENKRHKRLLEEVYSLLEDKFKIYIKRKLREPYSKEILSKVNNKEITSYDAVEEIFSGMEKN